MNLFKGALAFLTCGAFLFITIPGGRSPCYVWMAVAYYWPLVPVALVLASLLVGSSLGSPTFLRRVLFFLAWTPMIGIFTCLVMFSDDSLRTLFSSVIFLSCSVLLAVVRGVEQSQPKS